MKECPQREYTLEVGRFGARALCESSLRGRWARRRSTAYRDLLDPSLWRQPTRLAFPCLSIPLSSFQEGPRADSGDSLIVPKDQGGRRRLAPFFALEVEISATEH